MNKHKFGAYTAPQHDPDKWKKYLFDIDPPWVRILMPGDSPTQVVSDHFQLCKDAEISLRWWDLDDGGEPNKRAKILRGATAAKVDVQEAVRRIEVMENDAARHGMPFPPRSQLWLNTLNEKPTWEVELRPLIVEYEVAFINEAAKFGLGTMAGEWNVGHPSEWPPQWGWYKPVIDAIGKCDGVLSIHEYWQPGGPMHEWTDHAGNSRKDWGALAGRYQHIPYDVTIVVTETGVDGRIFNHHATPDTGFAKFMSTDAYAHQMRQYLNEVKKDKRIACVLPFITDYHDSEWASFDTLPAHVAFENMLREMDHEKQPSVPVTVHIPSLHSGGNGGQPDVQPPAGPSAGVHAATLNPYVLNAILQVESNGQGFNADGRLKIRFEAHIFERYIPKNIFDAHFRYDKNDILSAYYRHSIHNPWMSIHIDQSGEYTALEIARTINNDAALMSTSFGAAQIMGFNFRRVGFATPQEMMAAFLADPAYHTISLLTYCLNDLQLVTAIASRDWRTIARLYNGPGLVDLYSVRLEKAYKRLKGEPV
jgi:hypothetical protein